jgi:reactive intermediate/imine deaminase
MSQSKKVVVHSDAAPSAIGPYSQAIRSGQTVYLSGQVPLNPATGQLISNDFPEEVRQVLKNLSAVAQAAGGTLADAVRFGVYLTDLNDFAQLNAIMPEFVPAPFPARSTIQVAALPRGARVEIDAVLVLAN